MRIVSRGLPIVVFLAAALAAVLVSQPWDDGDTVREAAADTIEYRLCDTVLEAPPAVVPAPGQERLAVRRGVALESYEPTLELQPSLELMIRGDISSDVFIDPMTGGILREQYGTPSQEATLREILETLRVEPLDPASGPWPYTGREPGPSQATADRPVRVPPTGSRVWDSGVAHIWGRPPIVLTVA